MEKRKIFDVEIGDDDEVTEETQVELSDGKGEED